jgi:hypothetical protein
MRQAGPVYSADGAAGLAVAVGNVAGMHAGLGTYDAGDTYLSRDGGATWRWMRPGPHRHALADWGGVIVLVSDNGPTDRIWSVVLTQRHSERERERERDGCGCIRAARAYRSAHRHM